MAVVFKNEKRRDIGKIVEGLAGSKVWFCIIMKKLKGECLSRFSFILRLEGKMVANSPKCLFEVSYILMIVGDSIMFQLLFLFYLFLVVMAIPKVIVAADVV